MQSKPSVWGENRRPASERDDRSSFDDEEVTLAGTGELSDPEAGTEFEPEHETSTGRLPAPPRTSWAELLDPEPTPLDDEVKAVDEPERAPGHVTPYSFSVPDSPASLVASVSVLTGPMAGQVYPLEDEETTLGRSFLAQIQIDDVKVSRLHARFIREGPGEYYVEDLASKNGTFLDGKRVTRTRLFSGDRLHVGPNTALRFGLVAADEVALQRRLYECSAWDALTGTLTRHRLLRNLALKLEEARETNKPLSLVLLDVDHFKRINDAFGHEAGDRALRILADRLKRSTPADCLLGRLGGEEFVMVLAHRGLQEAVSLAHRLRRKVARLSVEVGNGCVNMTISVGVASVSEVASYEPAVLLNLADQRMLRAKRSGRNRVCATGN